MITSSWTIFLSKHCELLAQGKYADHESDEFLRYLKRRFSSAMANNTALSIRDTLEEINE